MCVCVIVCESVSVCVMLTGRQVRCFPRADLRLMAAVTKIWIR